MTVDKLEQQLLFACNADVQMTGITSYVASFKQS